MMRVQQTNLASKKLYKLLKIFYCLFFIIFIFSKNAFAYQVECDGFDSDTGEYVYGTCTNGNFDGYDSDTGEYVYGSCERGGDIDAYNSDTGEYVYGSCNY